MMIVYAITRYMKLDLSTREYRDLLKALDIALWVSEDLDEGNDAYHTLAKKIDELFERTLKAGYEDGETESVMYESGQYYAAGELATYAEKVITDYREIIFWEELEHRLGKRDFLDSIGEDKTSPVYEFGLPEDADKFIERYGAEFDVHGIERLRLDETL